MAECRALKPSDIEGNARRVTKSVISPESDAEVRHCDLPVCPASRNGTEMWESGSRDNLIVILSQISHTLLQHASISTAFDKTPSVLCTGPLFSTSAFSPAAMAEEPHRLPGQVRGSVRKSCSAVSHRQPRLQMMLRRVSDTVIRKK
jgi:hypothetical protein